MKKLALLCLALVVGMVVFLGVRSSLKPVGAQMRTSNSAQSRYANNAVSRGYVVSSSTGSPCTNYTATEACVTPTAAGSVGLIGGVATEDCAAGALCPIAMTGIAECLFDNTPMLGQLAFHNGPLCDSQPGNLLSVTMGTGVVGFISALDPNDATRAWVTMYRPGATGYLVPASQTTGFAPVATSGLYGALTGLPTIPAAQVNSDWNAVSGVAQILNKPSLTNGTVTGVTATSPVVSSGGNAPAISCPTCLTATGSAWYLNNVLVKGNPGANTMKCDSLTGTTNGSGVLAFNYSAMGYTTLWGLPQPTVQGTGTNSYTVNLQGAATTTGATVIAYQSSLITVVGISVSLIGVASSAPVGLVVCGY